MTTTTVTVTHTWSQQIAVADDPWILQNRGPLDIQAFYKSTAPAAGDSGIVLKTGEGLASGVHGVGDVWIRSIGNASTISLTK